METCFFTVLCIDLGLKLLNLSMSVSIDAMWIAVIAIKTNKTSSEVANAQWALKSPGSLCGGGYGVHRWWVSNHIPFLFILKYLFWFPHCFLWHMVWALRLSWTWWSLQVPSNSEHSMNGSDPVAGRRWWGDPCWGPEFYPSCWPVLGRSYLFVGSFVIEGIRVPTSRCSWRQGLGWLPWMNSCAAGCGGHREIEENLLLTQWKTFCFQANHFIPWNLRVMEQ